MAVFPGFFLLFFFLVLLFLACFLLMHVRLVVCTRVSSPHLPRR